MRRGFTAGLSATAMVFGLAGVPTMAASPAAQVEAPGKCAEIVQVWAGGLPSSAMTDAVSLMPGAPSIRTVVVPAGRHNPLTVEHFRRLKKRGLSDPYFRGYRARAAKVADALRDQSRRCPDALLTVGGHSDGAVVARAALRLLSTRTDTRVVRRVGVVLLFGDPLARRSDGNHLTGKDVRGVLVGRGPQLRLPEWAEKAGVVQSWCISVDPVCRPDARAVDISVHDFYDVFDDPREERAGESLARYLDYLPTDRVVRAAYAAEPGTRVSVRTDDLFGNWSTPAVVSARLPRGVSLRRGVLSGSLPEGRHVAWLKVRSGRVAPALTRTVKVVISVRPLAAAAGTALITRGVDGKPADAASSDVHVSRDGRTVAFASKATNLVTTDLSRALGDDASVAYAWDASTGRVELVGIGPDGTTIASAPIDVRTMDVLCS